jgi:hypothetical protein
MLCDTLEYFAEEQIEIEVRETIRSVCGHFYPVFEGVKQLKGMSPLMVK